jgi:cell division protein YceG involved in septum cleavage
MRTYLQYSGLDTSLQAGEYELSPAKTPVEIAQIMQDATPSHVTFSVLPGWRLEEIARALPSSGLEISPKAFLAAARIHSDKNAFLKDVPFGTLLEGISRRL